MLTLNSTVDVFATPRKARLLPSLGAPINRCLIACFAQRTYPEHSK